MHRFWVHAEPDTARMAESPEFVQQRLGDNSLGIISDNDRRAVLDSWTPARASGVQSTPL